MVDVADRNSGLDISVLIATYNRAEILRQTLESMTLLDREGLAVEFVVVDNNSSDHTKQVVESFSGKLPIRYLFEPRPGQNCARNRAITDVELGDVVVFTDDDIEPRKDWLKAIISASAKWPKYAVFGGQIYPIWPDKRIPSWASNKSIQEFCFARHHLADSEVPYPSGSYPFGGNFWVRREVFATERRFCETIGPRPGGYVMGSETSFLKVLAEEGYGMVYSPNAVVGHHVRPEQLSIWDVLRKAYRHGRGIAHMRPLCRRHLLDKHPVLWCLIRVGAIAKLVLLFVISLVLLALQKPEMAIRTVKWIGYNIESLRIRRNKN